ncbi:hypothetical protein SAMN05421676_10243 [Salinibacillus kushneri]|uniref:Uncharacterized protein n=1 Tax=Salinibacillus kushneri TaxID=237682 RepID=A0A1I0A5J6_9BACI|nr:hypothetical protein [Salinibacillus kushneri]SES89380.1 hypothetical protein SAMN05421676_10243 [Salinibacillus kushneri]
MGYYFGITFNKEHYVDIEERLKNHANFLNRELKMYLLVNIDLLELYIQFIDPKTVDRVLLYDYKELGNWEDFKRFSKICKKYGLEYSIIQQDIHSDVDLPIGYLTDII